jgi:hypothetical protein
MEHEAGSTSFVTKFGLSIANFRQPLRSDKDKKVPPEISKDAQRIPFTKDISRKNKW